MKNEEAWELFIEHPGLLSRQYVGLGGHCVYQIDYRAAQWVLEAESVQDAAMALGKLEAIAQGLNQHK